MHRRFGFALLLLLSWSWEKKCTMCIQRLHHDVLISDVLEVGGNRYLSTVLL